MQQAEVFHALLAAHRAELCDRFDHMRLKLARFERIRDSARARRQRMQIRESC